MSDEYSLIAPKFRSRKAYVKEMDKISTLKSERGDIENDNSRIAHYVEGVDESRECFARALVCFGNNTHLNRYLLVADCIKNNNWNLFAYRNTWIRLFIRYQIAFYNFERVYAERDDAIKGSVGLPQSIGDFVAMIAIFGNRLLFENAMKFGLDLFDRQLVGGNITYLTQLFILQLSEKFLGYTPRNWLEDKHWGVDPRKEEPLFAELWNHWDDAETDILEALLIQLLNRHTYQASRNNKDGGRDFEGHSEQYPMEVHFIFRLRKWCGLSNPLIKHRLMEAPFDVLPEPMIELVFDEQTIAFVKKVRQVFSDFDTIINNAKIRDWKMLL